MLFLFYNLNIKKTIMKNNSLLLMAILMLILPSCSDSDSDSVSFNATADVYIMSIIENNEVLYAPVYKVVANSEISDAKVLKQDDDSEDIVLLASDDTNTEFIVFPKAEDFSKEKLSKITCDFEISPINGDVVKISDAIGEKDLQPANLSTYAYDADTHKIDLVWDELVNADVYQVNITKEKNGVVMFNSGNISLLELSIDEDSKEWTKLEEMKKGDEYYVSITACSYEDSKSPISSEIEMKSVVYKKIVW